MRPPEPRPWDPPRAEVPEAAPDEPEESVDRPLERARLCERWSNVGGPGDASVEGIGHAALAAHAVAERHTFQPTVNFIVPGVIDACET
jgi:hypothetical protein